MPHDTPRKGSYRDALSEVPRRSGVQGTHTGETQAFGLPTGNRIDMTGLVIVCVVGGKAQSWIVYDALGMMQQLGFIPEAQQAGS
jgi:hypothetical protein